MIKRPDSLWAGKFKALANGVEPLTAGGVTNLQGGARIKGATNSLVNTAGTMNQSANVSLAGGVASGVITSAET